MANAYRPFFAETEQDFIEKLDIFLENIVGWYRTYTHSDTGTNTHYSWRSEGSQDRGLSDIVITASGLSNEVGMAVSQYQDRDGNFSGLYLGIDAETEMRGVTTPGRCRSWANKDRVIFMAETTQTARQSAYFGWMDSFYSTTDDPFPAMIRGSTSVSDDWISNVRLYALDRNDSEVAHKLYFADDMVDEGYPNPRNGEFSFFRPILYYDGFVQDLEVRGRPIGVFYGKPDRLGHGSVISIGGDVYMAVKTTDESDATIFGPISDDGTIPLTIIQMGFPSIPDYSVDYTNRGLEFENQSDGTLALWRFDAGSDYQRTSGDSYANPATLSDETDDFNLTAQNNVTLTPSRLQEAVEFNGSNQYATASGTTDSVNALNDEWTFETIFRPLTIPSSGNSTIVEYGSSGSTEDDNVLLSISLATISGTSPDEWDRGNINVAWEKDTKLRMENTTTTDFVYEDRWNYLAVVKKNNGSNYDVQVWHCSFGDYVEPVLRQEFLGIDNSTGGSNSGWYFGSTTSGIQYYHGRIDDSRLTMRALTEEEIQINCSRTML